MLEIAEPVQLGRIRAAQERLLATRQDAEQADETLAAVVALAVHGGMSPQDVARCLDRSLAVTSALVAKGRDLVGDLDSPPTRPRHATMREQIALQGRDDTLRQLAAMTYATRVFAPPEGYDALPYDLADGVPQGLLRRERVRGRITAQEYEQVMTAVGPRTTVAQSRRDGSLEVLSGPALPDPPPPPRSIRRPDAVGPRTGTGTGTGT